MNNIIRTVVLIISLSLSVQPFAAGAYEEEGRKKTSSDGSGALGGALMGGLLGAGLGAAIGSASGNAGKGAAIGAGVGAVGGTLVGANQESQRRAQEEEESYPEVDEQVIDQSRAASAGQQEVEGASQVKKRVIRKYDDKGNVISEEVR